ncbi:MAG TPA: caspase family protein, partial [Chitinophagaceae bacterium]|nr:caspase family protein [Chitinophagaceae bacterium]
FTNDAKQLLTVSSDKTIRYIETEYWRTIKTINADEKGDIGALNGSQEFLLFSNNGKLIKYDCKTGKTAYTFFAVDEKDYLVTDNNNHYDGTEAARKLLYFTCGTEVIELDQVKDQLWVPDLAERIMKGDSIQAKTLDELNICGLTPEVQDISNKKDVYAYKIIPRRGGLGKTILYVNGIEARQYQPRDLVKKDNGYELLIKKEELGEFLIKGKENPVLVKAFTAADDISSRGVVINAVANEKTSIAPNLFAVVIGVSDYKGDELDLKYADKDATDISNAISLSAKKLLNTGDGHEHVFMYKLTTAKDHDRLPEKKAIKKVLEEVGNKARANDILLVFFAGHGVMAKPKGNNSDKKQFYFLTADASSSTATDAINDVGISTEELTDWMQPKLIKAQKRVFIFDACNSGQAISDFVKMGKEGQGYISARGDDKSQLMKAIDKLNEKSGLFILSASASNQNAYEMGRYSQGLLTYSLLKAIKQQPDILTEGKYLDLGRWFNAAKETVSDLSRESGARQEPQVISNTNFNIGMVDEEVMSRISLPAEKPVFTAGNF